MNGGRTFLTGIGVGAGLAYFLDPDRGRRRRALARDQLASLWFQTDDVWGKTSRDISQRAQGLMAETEARFRHEDVVDQVLVARVRAKLGRIVSHPRAIEVTVDQGHVILSGPILRREVDDLLAAVSSVRGVNEVENRLDVYERADDVPGLQGGGLRPDDRFELMQEVWSPGARLLAGVGGGLLTLSGARWGGLAGVTLSAAGFGMLARAVTNMEFQRFLGVGGGRRGIDVQKTINLNAPIEEVFAFWSNFENFPRFMTHVREVRDLGNGRSHWTVAGPMGISVEWDAVITKQTQNEVLAWKSIAGSPIANAGIIRFDPNHNGGTRVTIRLSYNPPAGAFGHLVATLFGADPKHEIDDDLVRLKSLIDVGKATAHGHTVTREEVAPAVARGAGAEQHPMPPQPASLQPEAQQPS